MAKKTGSSLTMDKYKDAYLEHLKAKKTYTDLSNHLGISTKDVHTWRFRLIKLLKSADHSVVLKPLKASKRKATPIDLTDFIRSLKELETESSPE